MKIERRDVTSAEVRTSDSEPGVFEAVVLRYGVVDTYNTIFDPGCFRESLEERMPRITWGHEWTDVIGRYVDHKDTRDGLTLVGQLDDFDAVPRARQAHAQLKSGTIDQFSVGFHRKPGGTTRDADDREHFTRAGLDEAALVLSASVPGTSLVSVRSVKSGSRRQVPEEYLDHLAQQVEAGAMTKAQALVAIDLAAGDTTEIAPPPDETPEVSEVLQAEADAVLADLDAL
jgi:HK97 family phage prohead protease